MKRTVALSVFVVLLVSLLLAVSSAQSQQDTRQQPLVFTHVTLIDMTGAPAKPDMIVLITGERITALGKVDEIPIPRGAQVVAAIGKFLIPGLWDMHVHTLGKEKVETFFPLFIANGVTGVRDMGTTPDGFSGLKQWRKQIAEGTRLGPRIVAAGSIVDGAKPQLRAISIAVNNEAEARQTVRYLKQRGADFIKVYSRLSRRAYYAVADEAKKQGCRLPVTCRSLSRRQKLRMPGKAASSICSACWKVAPPLRLH